MKREKRKKNNFPSKSKVELIAECIEDKSLKNTVKACNEYGVRVAGFFPSFDFFETSYITLKILRGNEKRIFNILQNLEAKRNINVEFLSYGDKNVETVKIFANWWHKKEVFKIIQEAVKKKCDLSKLSDVLKEIYNMHKLLTKEDISHRIHYAKREIIYYFSISNLHSYFSFGLNRVKDIFKNTLGERIDKNGDWQYEYSFHFGKSMLMKLKTLNQKLENEFKWQSNELEALSARYRKNPNEEDTDMFKRLAKIRDEHEVR